MAELIAYGKANPGKISFGSGSTSSRMAGEMLKSMAGIDMVNVQYKSNPQAVTDLLGGQIQLVIADAVTTMPHAKAGKLKALAISTAKRSPIAPELPTVAESGLPGYEMIGWFAAYVPAKTPKDIIAKLNSEIVRILESADEHARWAGGVPAGRDGEVGEARQGGGHPARIGVDEDDPPGSRRRLFG